MGEVVDELEVESLRQARSAAEENVQALAVCFPCLR